MIKASLPIEAGTVAELEDALYELAPSNWSLVVSHLDGKGLLEGFFDSEEQAVEAGRDLESLLGEPFAVPFDLKELIDRDWKEAYKHHFHPWAHDNIHWVPIWEKESYLVPEDHHALYLDPGMAFGTGNHETTRLCLQALVSILADRANQVADCLDVGCGSGILSLSASLLGIKTVKGVDCDPDAIKVSIDNASLNSIEGKVDFETLPLEDLPEGKQYDVVLANIQADVLLKNSDLLVGQVRDGGTLVLSGILTREMEKVEAGFLERIDAIGAKTSPKRESLNEWSSLRFNLGK